MDYSNLVNAVQQGKQDHASAILEDLVPRLLRFLRIHMHAARQDAEDCAQDALIETLEAIKADKIRDKERILSFLLTACRNNYLNLIQKHNKTYASDFKKGFQHKPQQLTVMLNNERRHMLEQCIQHLSDSYQTFIRYWFMHPDSDSKAASTHFEITVENVWTRKHRIIKKLQLCLQKKDAF